MIEPQLIPLSQSLQQSVFKLLLEVPRYVLDFTYPSLGTIDLLLFPLRGKRTFSEDEASLLLQASAYCGICAYRMWSGIDEKMVLSLDFDPSNRSDIVLTAKGGKYLPQRQSAKVSITRAIIGALALSNDGVPVYHSHTRQFTSDESLISALFLGIFSGLSPLIEGPWGSRDLSSHVEFLEGVDRNLILSIQEYYQRVFPGESLGRHPELFGYGTLLPPPLCEEESPYLRVSNRVLENVKKLGLSKESRFIVGKNLSTFRDDAISRAGTLLAFLSSPEAIGAVSPLQGLAGIELRQTLATLHLQNDLAQLRGEISEEEHFNILLKQERSLNFLPSLTLSSKSAFEYTAITEMISWGEFELCLDALIQLVSEELLQTPELLIQGLELARQLGAQGEGELLLSLLNFHDLSDGEGVLRDLYGAVFGDDQRSSLQRAVGNLEKLEELPRYSHLPEFLRELHLKNEVPFAATTLEWIRHSFPSSPIPVIADIESKFLQGESAEEELPRALRVFPRSPEIFQAVIQAGLVRENSE